MKIASKILYVFTLSLDQKDRIRIPFKMEKI